MTGLPRLRLFKLRVFDQHCHVVASHDGEGRALDLPGVDLRGAEAAAAFEAAAPLLAMVRGEGGGAAIRAVSVHLERRRLLATFEAAGDGNKPSVARIEDQAGFDAVLSAAEAVSEHLREITGARLAARPVPLPVLADLDPTALSETSSQTIAHYSRAAEAFWEGTRDHDVSQNVGALLRHLPEGGPHTILDLGCGPGRDLATFRELGHVAVGLDGSLPFVEMARSHSSCEVFHQSFLDLRLPAGRFDGIFANASLFHVPSQELPRVLSELHAALANGGTLFASNPHGANQEGWSRDRYSCFLDLETLRRFMAAAGFDELEHYYRPAGEPRHRQPWLAAVWRRREAAAG